MNNCNNKGFTLAEVLITLVIIGVIAAMTIPTVVNDTKKQEYVAGVKKAYSTLRQAMINMARNNDSAVGDYSFLRDINFIDEFAKVTNVVKKENNISGCFGSDYSEKYETLDKTQSGLGDDLDSQCCIMSDGMIYAYRLSENAFSHGLSAEDVANSFAWIAVDVNGAKGPNVWGRDLFLFDLTTTKGVIPAGSESASSCNKNSTGFSCTAKVLRENAMNY